MPRPLPLRANLEWLRKLGKERLASLRVADPNAKLSDAQLHVAREYGFSSWRQLKAQVEEVRLKLDAMVPPDVRRQAAMESVSADDPDLTKFLAAITDGQPEVINEMLRCRPALVIAKGPQGQTGLHMAAQFNEPAIASVLVAYGADFEAKFGGSAHTPLSWAVTCNAIECARALVKLGSEQDLFCAAGIGDLEYVQTCFEGTGALIPGASKTGSSRYAADGTLLSCPPSMAREQVSDALYIACRNGQADVVRFLIGKNPDLTFRAYLGASALHWAYFSGSRAVVQLLEQHGADPEMRDDTLGCTPRSFGICVSANWGFGFLVKARLAEDPGLVNMMDGRTSPLHEAVRMNNVDMIHLLLKHGANPSLKNGDGKTPLDVATELGLVEPLEILRAKGAS